MNKKLLSRLIGGAIVVVVILVWALWSTPVPCAPVTVPANTSESCPAGGNYCAASEGQHCDGTWPLRKHCKTVYTTAGTCDCRCQ